MKTVTTLVVVCCMSIVSAPAFGANTLAEAMRAELEESLPDNLEAVEVRTPPQPLAKGARVTLRFGGEPKTGWSTFGLEIKDKKGKHTVWATARIVEKRNVLVVKRAIAAGDKIGASDLAIERRGAVSDAMTMLPSGPIVAAHAIAPGTVLAKEDLMLPTATRGTSVQVVVRRSGVTIATAGVLEQRAMVGDRALVRVHSTQRVVSGVLSDTGTVELAGGTL